MSRPIRRQQAEALRFWTGGAPGRVCHHLRFAGARTLMRSRRDDFFPRFASRVGAVSLELPAGWAPVPLPHALRRNV